MSLVNDLQNSYTWTISDYADLMSNVKTKSPVIKSEKFTMAENPEIKWCLVLQYYQGRYGRSYCGMCGSGSNGGNGYLSLFLKNCKINTDYGSIYVDFSILNATNDKVFTRKKEISGVIIKNKKYGFDHFISQKDLCSCLLVNKNLIILCEIKTIPDAGSSAGWLLFKGFDSFINDETFSDVALLIGKKKIYAHKLILSSKSPVFHRMFLTEMKESYSNEVKVNDIKFEVFYELLRFLYTSKVEKLDEYGFDLYRAANFYQIVDLKLICERAFRKRLEIENSIDILKLSDQYGAKSLKKHCMNFIINNFTEISCIDAFKNLNKKPRSHLLFELLVKMGSKKND